MALIQGGNNTPGIANVDSNYALVVNPQTTENNAGFVSILYENDDGTVTGSRELKSPYVSESRRLKSGIDSILFNLSFEGTTVPRAHIQQNLSTFNVSQGSGFIVINSLNDTSNNSNGTLKTYRTFPIYGTFSTDANLWLKEANITSTGTVSEWGFGYVSGTSAPTDGVLFRRASGGALTAVINYAGSETSASITTTNVPSRDGVGLYDATECNHYKITINVDQVQFYINNTLVATILSPATSPIPCSAQNQPLFMRVYNTTPSAARRIEIGFLTVTQGDINCNKPWGHQLCGMGGGAYQVQQGNTSAMTANWANSAAPASASLSNTAAGYTTLGGQWQFAATATVETDWALFGYTNPAGTASLPGKTLYITGIRIGETFVTGAAVGTTTMFFWAAGVASSAVSLATVDGAATVAPRRIALGGQSFIAGAAVGTQASGFFVDFSQAPLVVPTACFAHIIIKQLGGTNTASLVFRGTVTVIGYWE